MIQYLGSDEFQKTPPKILIWESRRCTASTRKPSTAR